MDHALQTSFQEFVSLQFNNSLVHGSLYCRKVLQLSSSIPVAQPIRNTYDNRLEDPGRRILIMDVVTPLRGVSSVRYWVRDSGHQKISRRQGRLRIWEGSPGEEKRKSVGTSGSVGEDNNVDAGWKDLKER
ncbi:hypothetical protein NPIL_480531 [Nephila pilipes]|uniref:Uncharacterized protein n=1 Tax=Nephila pilipes TaxID=299642 RepID=A0A8X6N1J6_NEPPI|nr:hypothetical protein NPIL_480531 [Nephila pilipes]